MSTNTDPGVIEEQKALSYIGGGSDKVYGIGYSDGGLLFCVYGKRGAALQGKPAQKSDKVAAKKIFDQKLKEKLSEGYVEIAFDDPRFGVASFGPLRSALAAGPLPATTLEMVASAIDAANETVEYVSSHLTPLEAAEVEQFLEDQAWGLTEKVNGNRCQVAYDPARVETGLGLFNNPNAAAVVTAYNRRGIRTSTAPDSARQLARLGKQFVMDGERMEGDEAGDYIIFDLLEWDGQDLRPYPYLHRITTLYNRLREAEATGQVSVAGYGPVADASKRGLQVLISVTDPPIKRDLVEFIRQRNGEGFVLRDMAAPYLPGNTKNTRKWKFMDELDALVIGFKPGVAYGSLILGLVRPADGAVIEICSARSGLFDADVIRLKELFEQGYTPVIRVSFLGIRSVGYKLVEPQFNGGWSCIRTDKLPEECLTDQRPDRHEHYAAAPATSFTLQGRKTASPDWLEPETEQVLEIKQ